MLRRHAFGDGTGNFFQVLADQAGPCSVDVLATARWWAGDAPQACFWLWFGRLFHVPVDGSSAGMLSVMVWLTFSTCQLTRLGHVLSICLASGRRWAGDAPQACFWGWFGQLFPGAG